MSEFDGKAFNPTPVAANTRKSLKSVYFSFCLRTNRQIEKECLDLECVCTVTAIPRIREINEKLSVELNLLWWQPCAQQGVRQVGKTRRENEIDFFITEQKNWYSNRLSNQNCASQRKWVFWHNTIQINRSQSLRAPKLSRSRTVKGSEFEQNGKLVSNTCLFFTTHT